MIRTILVLCGVAILPVLTARAVVNCDLVATETVAKVKDAIANARANCPDVGGTPQQFDYVRTYDNSDENVTRECNVTEQEDSFSFQDGAMQTRSISTSYFYLITEDQMDFTDRPEVALYTKKDPETGFFNVSFQILAGSLTEPIAVCTGIIDDTETDTFVDSVIECISDFDLESMSFGKDASGTWCR